MAIRDLKPGSRGIMKALVKIADPKFTNTAPAREYYDLTVIDSTGELLCKVWDITERQKEVLIPFQVVEMDVEVSVYRDKLQGKVHSVTSVDPNNVDLEEFIKKAPADSVEMLKVIEDEINKIPDDTIRTLVNYCLDQVRDVILSAPAAKSMHHAYYGGLLYHTLRMLQIAKFICLQRKNLYKPLLIGGLIIHDFEKCFEMVHQMGVVSDYSFKGQLIGHIPMIYGRILDGARASGIDPEDEKVILLQHMVLSHHGTLEWGSPTQPKILEAIALHYIDQLDAKMQAAEDALKALPEGKEWTDKVFMLDKVAIYNHGFSSEE